jgi:hypothetical protein
MKTKTVHLYCDIWPGWQDGYDPKIGVDATSNPQPTLWHKDARRIKITVELPCFGGRHHVDWETTAKCEDVTCDTPKEYQ